MLAKAIIQEIQSPYKWRVRIPTINKIEGVNGATPNDELYIAPVCSPPNFVMDARVGDVVIVGFENDETSKPIVLGYLSLDKDVDASSYLKCEEITVSGDAHLSANTFIGDVSPQNILCLKGQNDNIHLTLESLSSRVKELERLVGELDKQLTTII